MAVNKAKLQEAIECLQTANQLQQAAGLTPDEGETDVSYEVHNIIESLIEVLEEQLD